MPAGGFGLCCADGEAAHRFVQFTERVIATEEVEIPERIVSATLAEPLADGADLALRFSGGRHGRIGRLRVTLPFEQTVAFELEVADVPLRHAVGWNAHVEEHFVDLGARHALRVDHAGWRIQLGADRA